MRITVHPFYRFRRGSGLALAAILLSATLAVSCAAPEPDRAQADTAPGSLVLTVAPGKNWTRRASLFYKTTPTFAGWVETTDGEYVSTLAVSAKAGAGTWYGSPEGGRPESLPVWYAAARVRPEDPSVPEGAGQDAVSAASSPGGVSVSSLLRLQSGREYVARFEINQSFDYNDTWKKGGTPGESGWSGVNGQPSLLYEACFVYGNPETIRLVPVGRGAVDGSGGEPVLSLAGMTSALEIADSITLEVR